MAPNLNTYPLPAIGERKGRMVITDHVAGPNGSQRLRIQCDCGTERVITPTYWRRPSNKSCGCYRRTPALPRFWAFVKVLDNGCWQWQGGLNIHGYSNFQEGGNPVSGHQWAYLNFVGPIPIGEQLDHTCRNRGCVNPNHLEPVTQSVNLMRGARVNQHAYKSYRTHCKAGHEFTSDNTETIENNGRVARKCIACARARALKYIHAHRAKARAEAAQ